MRVRLGDSPALLRAATVSLQSSQVLIIRSALSKFLDGRTIYLSNTEKLKVVSDVRCMTSPCMSQLPYCYTWIGFWMSQLPYRYNWIGVITWSCMI